MIMLNDFMQIAIDEAKKVKVDIPVCAIIVKDNKIIASEVNQKELLNKTIYHAEILAINKANEVLNSWRLDDCDMYVTLEPCPMCMWAILNSRIKRLYFGAYDIQYGAAQSVLKLSKIANSKIEIYGGIKEIECNKIFKDYFRGLR